MEEFTTKKIVQKLNILKDCQPLTFAYSISHEQPESHKLHINRFYEIYMLVQGDTDYIVEDSYFSLQPGDIIIINPYEVHKAVLKSTALYERFYFLVPENLFHNFTYDPILLLMSGQKKLIRLSDENRKKALALLYNILHTLDHDTSITSHFSAYGMLLQFIALLNSNSFVETSDHTEHLPHLVGEALKYVNQNLTDIDSVEQIADQLGVSLPYLSSTFKNAIGTPIVKYIQTRKIAFAKTLLDHNASVTEACFDSGFHDCAYFIKIFKQHTGITPLQYQKLQQNTGKFHLD